VNSLRTAASTRQPATAVLTRGSELDLTLNHERKYAANCEDRTICNNDLVANVPCAKRCKKQYTIKLYDFLQPGQHLSKHQPIKTMRVAQDVTQFPYGLC